MIQLFVIFFTTHVHGFFTPQMNRIIIDIDDSLGQNLAKCASTKRSVLVRTKCARNDYVGDWGVFSGNNFTFSSNDLLRGSVLNKYLIDHQITITTYLMV